MADFTISWSRAFFSRKVFGWAFSRKLNAELTKSALRVALYRHPPKSGCRSHSDLCFEFVAQECHDMVVKAGMVRSMVRKGNRFDNAFVGSHFYSMNAELIYHKLF